MFGHTEADGQPSKKSKKGGGRGSVALLKESFQLGCVSQHFPSKKNSTESWKMRDQITPSNSPRARGTTWKIRERKGPSQGVMHKCEPQERNPCAPKYEENTSGNLATRTMRPQRSMGLGKTCFWAQNKGQGHVLLSYQSMGDAGTLFH